MWRYQAVYRRIVNRDSESIEYSICEVYLDEDGKLEGSTESPTMTPHGNTRSELIDDLKMMLEDVSKWKAVDFDMMQVGMVFERINNEQELGT